MSFDFLMFFQSLVLIHFCLFLLKDPAYIVALPYVLVNFLHPLILIFKCLDFTCATCHVVIDLRVSLNQFCRHMGVQNQPYSHELDNVGEEPCHGL